MLARVKHIIPALVCKQLFMAAFFNNLPVLDNGDYFGISDGREAVCDDKDSFAFHQSVHAPLDKFFRAGVDGAGSLVSIITGALRRAGYGQKLALAWDRFGRYP